MKSLLTLVVLASVATCASAAGVEWAKDEQTAFATAKQAHKIVMVDFYTDWCGWCKRLDEGAYKDPKVASLTGRLVALKINAEKEGAALAKKNGVNSYPTIIFFNPDGSVFAKLDGYQPAPDFANTVNTVLDISTRFGAVKAKLASSPNDGQANAEMANFIALKSPNLELQALLTNRALASNYRGPYLARALNALGDAYQNAGNEAEMVASYRKAVQFATNPADKSTALANLMYALVQKDKAAAKTAADQLIALPNATEEWVEIAKDTEKEMASPTTGTP